MKRYIVTGAVALLVFAVPAYARAADVTSPTAADTTGATEPAASGNHEDASASGITDSTASLVSAYPDSGNRMPGSSSDIVIHGFASQGYIRSTANNYLARSNGGSFEFGEVGINFTKQLTDRFGIGLQIFAQSLGASGKFAVKADWYQLDYRFANWLGLRAGRIKLPFGLYNDISDIDAARVPILLPQSIYPIQNRDFLLAQSGAEAYGDIDLGAGGDLDYRFYGGTIILDFPENSGAFEISDLSAPYIVGGRTLWESPLEGLRLGGSLQALRLDTNLFVPAITTTVSVKIPAVLWVGSLEYTLGDFQAAAEFSRWYVQVESSNTRVFPETPTVSQRMYGMASYRLTEWFQSGVYYSVLIPNIGRRSGRESKQNDLAGTLRFDINPYWLLKLEGHLMSGTAGLNPQLNAGTPRNLLEDRWGVFLLKTTAYF